MVKKLWRPTHHHHHPVSEFKFLLLFNPIFKDLHSSSSVRTCLNWHPVFNSALSNNWAVFKKHFTKRRADFIKAVLFAYDFQPVSTASLLRQLGREFNHQVTRRMEPLTPPSTPEEIETVHYYDSEVRVLLRINMKDVRVNAAGVPSLWVVTPCPVTTTSVARAATPLDEIIEYVPETPYKKRRVEVNLNLTSSFFLFSLNLIFLGTCGFCCYCFSSTTNNVQHDGPRQWCS